MRFLILMKIDNSFKAFIHNQSSIYILQMKGLRRNEDAIKNHSRYTITLSLQISFMLAAIHRNTGTGYPACTG